MDFFARAHDLYFCGSLKNLITMKKMLLGMLGCLALSAMLLASCKKTTEANPNGEGSKIVTSSFTLSDPPKNQNGMLVFRDADHYFEYLDFLDDAIASIGKDDTLKDVHSVLQEIENGLSFTSIRRTTHEAFEAANLVGWATPEEIPDEHFISSTTAKSVLNLNLDVQIGDQIIHHINKDVVVNVDASATELLQEFSALPHNATMLDVMKVDPLRIHSAVIDVTGKGVDVGSHKTSTETYGLRW